MKRQARTHIGLDSATSFPLSAPSMVSFLVSLYFLPLSTSRSRTKYSDKETRSTESCNFPFRGLLPKDSFSWCPGVVDFLPHALRV